MAKRTARKRTKTATTTRRRRSVRSTRHYGGLFTTKTPAMRQQAVGLAAAKRMSKAAAALKKAEAAFARAQAKYNQSRSETARAALIRAERAYGKAQSEYTGATWEWESAQRTAGAGTRRGPHW